LAFHSITTTDFKSGYIGGSDYSTESLAGTVYYRAAPTDRINHDLSATLISDNFGSKQDRFDRVIGQGVGTFQWRSPSNEFAATSAVRLMAQQVNHQFAQEKKDTDSALMAASAGVSWRASNQLTMSLGARATAEHIQAIVDEREAQPNAVRSNYAGGLVGSMDYRSLPLDLAGFNWHWDARAAGDLGFNAAPRYTTLYGPRSDAQATIGHTLSKSLRLPWIETVNLSFLQEVGFYHYSYAEEFKPMKALADEAGASYFRVYLRDNHGFGDRPEEYQTAQFDFTRQVQLTGNQSLQGSLGVQVVRQLRDQNDDTYAFSRADVEYEYRDLFKIDGLSFLSTLRINALGRNDPVHDWRDELSPDLFRNDWRNRIQYRIGKLWLTLEGTAFQADDKFGQYVRFSGRRSFDFVD
jgi:hypothetical protein